MSDVDRILNLLESFRGKTQVQTFLRARDIAHSGTWDVVRTKIQDGLRKDQISLPDLIQLLEDIEEHGNQYIYFYDFDPVKTPRISNREAFEHLLTAVERRTTLNKLAVVEKPSEEPVLVSAVYQPEKIKLKWVQLRSYRKPLGETIHGSIVTVRYQIISSRAVDLAILDMNEGRAMLCLEKIEPGVRDYGKQLNSLLDRLSRFADRDALTESSPLDLGNLMGRLNDKTFTEVRRRRYKAYDAIGGLIDVTSATERDDIYNGGLYEAGRATYTGALGSAYANVYWMPKAPELTREIHTIFPYKQAINAVVFTQRCLKEERDYVVSRIESIARGEP